MIRPKKGKMMKNMPSVLSLVILDLQYGACANLYADDTHHRAPRLSSSSCDHRHREMGKRLEAILPNRDPNLPCKSPCLTPALSRHQTGLFNKRSHRTFQQLWFLELLKANLTSTEMLDSLKTWN